MEKDALDHVRRLYAPPDDPVFELVPSTFDEFAKVLYTSMGSPVVTGENIWDIYRALLFRVERLEVAVDYIAEWETCLADMDPGSDIDLVAGKELGDRVDTGNDEGQYYMGGVNNGQGLGGFDFFG